MRKEILQNFLPWILYFVLAAHSLAKLDVAIIAALVTFLIFNFKSLGKGFILSWGTLVFFAFMLFSINIMKNQWVAIHAWIFSNGALAIIAWVSLMIGRPFTEQYAREQVEEKYWQTAIFININRILTSVWGGIFTFCMLVHIIKLYFPMAPNWFYEVLSDGVTILGIWFTAWFPGWYRETSINKAKG